MLVVGIQNVIINKTPSLRLRLRFLGDREQWILSNHRPPAVLCFSSFCLAFVHDPSSVRLVLVLYLSTVCSVSVLLKSA